MTDTEVLNLSPGEKEDLRPGDFLYLNIPRRPGVIEFVRRILGFPVGTERRLFVVEKEVEWAELERAAKLMEESAR